MKISDKAQKIIEKIQKTEISLSNWIVWFFVGFSFLCVSSTFVNLLFFRETLGFSIINSGKFVASIFLAFIPILAIVVTALTFFMKEDEVSFDKKSIVSWAKLVIEHIRDSDHPETFEPIFVPLINDILDSLKSAVTDYDKLISSTKNIYDVVTENESFQESWMGKDLLELCFLVNGYLSEHFEQSKRDG